MMSGDNLQRVIDAMSDGVYITDGNGVTVTVNKAYERITGIPRKTLAGLHMSEVVQRGYISRSVSLEVLKEQGPVTLTQTIGDDHKILVSGTPMFDRQGRLEYIVTTVRDVTELLQAKRAEEQLEQILQVREHYSGREARDPFVISRATQQCYDLAKRVAPTAAKILIQGETGTGKTLLARTIHDYSAVSQGPFIELNCAAMPESLLEAELFGYEPGAFTGALQKGKTGLLEAANNGTLFMDEIGDLPLSLQAKLLKVVAENRFIPVGGTQFKRTNFRLVSATHHNLRDLVGQGRFREDLLYRLSVVPLELPPLRERTEEIEALLNHYLHHFNCKYELDCHWHREVIELLCRYPWPGNVRELINLTERLVVTAEQSLITTAQLPREMRADNGIGRVGVSLKEQVEALEKQLIEQALERYGTTRQAAAALDIDQSTLVKKQQRWRAQQKANELTQNEQVESENVRKRR